MVPFWAKKHVFRWSRQKNMDSFWMISGFLGRHNYFWALARFLISRYTIMWYTKENYETVQKVPQLATKNSQSFSWPTEVRILKILLLGHFLQMFFMKCVLCINISRPEAKKYGYITYWLISSRIANCFKLTATLTYKYP